MSTTLFSGARICTPVDTGAPLAGSDQGRVASWETGALLCRDGRITAVGHEPDVRRAASGVALDAEIDCGGRCMIPGFVDPHTHICYVERREREFLARLEGAGYMEILASGGGILSSVKAVRNASEEELFAATRAHALSCLQGGTTTLEIKSGYGLSTEQELKQLRVIARTASEGPMGIVATFMGAHAVAPEFAGTPEGYVDLLIHESIPAIASSGLARFCDVFCERGVFSAAQSRRILLAARAAGLAAKLHADELEDTGGAALAAELGAVSADHLLAASESGLSAMAKAGVVAVLLPGTAYSMRKPYAPARRMMDRGLPLAIATDSNPGTSCTESMPFVFGLAVLQAGFSVSQALVAATLNAAYAIGAAAVAGSLSAGKPADFLLLDGETPGCLAYRSGGAAVAEVFCRGTRVWRAGGTMAGGGGRG